MSINLDSRSILVDALKLNLEDFELSNQILPSKSSLKAIDELYDLERELLEFAKDPVKGSHMLGNPPKTPNTDNMTEEDKDNAINEYHEMMRIYESQKLAMSMHVPYGDYIMIQNYLKKFKKVIAATPAIKGKRFHAFTKTIDEQNNNPLANLFNKSSQQG